MKKLAIAFLAALCILGFPTGVSAQEEFKRDMQQTTFIPKGQWIAGVSVNYAQSTQDNYQFLVIEDLSGDAYDFKVSPMLLYSFKDNLAVGGKFGFQRTHMRLDEGSIKISTDLHFDADNLYLVSNDYFGAAAFRNYISFGRSKRFGMFNEVQLQIGGGQSKLTDGRGDNISGNFQENFSMDIGLTPGLIMFLNNYSAIEVSVGVLGFGYRHTKTTTDQIYISDSKDTHANFKINLFSVSFGMVFYI